MDLSPSRLQRFLCTSMAFLSKSTIHWLFTVATLTCCIAYQGHSLAKSAAYQSSDVNMPEQIHISYGKSSTEVIFIWSTKYNDTSIIEYYTEIDKSDLETGEGQTLQFKENRGGWQYLHRVVIKDLKPDVKYYYAARGVNASSKSEQFSFILPKPDSVHTYMVYGDMGTLSKSLPFIVYEAKLKRYDAVFHIGDVAYDLGGEGGAIGDRFFNKIEQMAGRIPYMTVPGDHELFPESKEHFLRRFSYPNADWPMHSHQLWYSLDLGKVHFVCVSTEVFFSDRANIRSQMDWLVEDLDQANKNRDKYPWIIVLAHRPLYCSTDDKNEDCTKEYSLVRSHFEDMFYFYGVDLIISGHQHMYERTWPLYKKKVLAYNYIHPLGPVQIIIGTMGNHYLTEYSSESRAVWSAFVKSESSLETYGCLKVYNRTHLYWEVRSGTDNDVQDKILIVQRNHGSFNRSSIFIPDPLGAEGSAWLQKEREEKGDVINLKFFYLHTDDYANRIIVLLCTSIILLIGLCFKKKILNFIRVSCMKKDNGALPK